MFSLNDTNLPSDPLSCFENLIELTLIVIMTFDERIREKKVQYDPNKEAGKVSTLS